VDDVCRGERTRVDQFRRSVLNESVIIAESGMKEIKRGRPEKATTLYSLREWADPTKEPKLGAEDSD
jgi:hypothetical protein